MITATVIAIEDWDLPTGFSPATRTPEDYVARLTAAEANIIRLSERRVKEIRARLHLVTGRREDRLVFDVQNVVAQLAGFQPTAGKRASELLMQHYYRAAKVITQMNTAVLLNIEQRMLHRDDEPAVAIDQTLFQIGNIVIRKLFIIPTPNAKAISMA